MPYADVSSLSRVRVAVRDNGRSRHAAAERERGVGGKEGERGRERGEMENRRRGSRGENTELPLAEDARRKAERETEWSRRGAKGDRSGYRDARKGIDRSDI